MTVGEYRRLHGKGKAPLPKTASKRTPPPAKLTLEQQVNKVIKIAAISGGKVVFSDAAGEKFAGRVIPFVGSREECAKFTIGVMRALRVRDCERVYGSTRRIGAALTPLAIKRGRR